MFRTIGKLAQATLAAAIWCGTLLTFGISSVEASPAYPVVKTFEHPDGTTIELRLWGDEFAHGWETLDGYTVVMNDDTGYWEYAVRNSTGHLAPSGIIAERGAPPAAPYLRPSQAVIDAAREAEGAPPLGEFTHNSPPPWAGADTDVLFIMVAFSDLACTFTAAQMQTNLFGGGATGPGDLDDYFDEISYGALELDGSVVGCFALSNTKAFYDGTANGDDTLVNEAIALADPTVNFANFDNDGDLVVDALGIIYAGGGPHDGCDTDDPPSGSGGDELWPHSTSLPGPGTVTADGVNVDPYIIQSEITFGIADGVCDEIQTIGLFAHEFGHSLGLPDLYDTDNSSEGVGFWSTMGSQYRSTVNLADTPPHYDPWSKWFLGWITPTDLTGVNVTQSIPRAADNAFAVQLLNNPGGPHDWPGGSGEYFLVENRQLTGFDAQLPGCGILIWHLEESQSSNKNEGHTAGSHRLVDLEEADGLDELDSVGDRGDAGDPYPGTTNNTLFNDSTYPHSNLYDGSNTGVQVEIVDTACAEDMTVNFGEMPTADAGGPYVTPEGTDVTLDASGSTPASMDPNDQIDTYEWDLDNNGTYETPGVMATFDQVGQDGVFTVGLRVTTVGGAVDTDTGSVTVTNVAPSVMDLATDAPQDEGSAVSVSGTIRDPGWLEALSGTIDWDDGGGPQPLPGVLENVRPDATLTFNVSHTYGDNGTFEVEICGFDDDSSTCDTIAVQVDNVDPTAEILPTGAFIVGPPHTFLVHAGDPIDFEGRSTDPGSDDLILTWDWGDGSADTVTTYLVNPPNPDPFPSPSIQPRDVNDIQSHVFGEACLYLLSFSAQDDDGGMSLVDTANVIAVGNADQVRTAGYWHHQYKGNGKTDFTVAELECYLAIVGFLSDVFNVATDASTIGNANDVLFPGGNKGGMEQIFDRQLLAAWLNFANGAIEYDELVDTDGDAVPDTAFGDAIAAAEAVRLDPNATRAELEAQKQILERINSMHG